MGPWILNLHGLLKETWDLLPRAIVWNIRLQCNERIFNFFPVYLFFVFLKLTLWNMLILGYLLVQENCSLQTTFFVFNPLLIHFRKNIRNKIFQILKSMFLIFENSNGKYYVSNSLLNSVTEIILLPIHFRL